MFKNVATTRASSSGLQAQKLFQNFSLHVAQGTIGRSFSYGQ